MLYHGGGTTHETKSCDLRAKAEGENAGEREFLFAYSNLAAQWITRFLLE